MVIDEPINIIYLILVRPLTKIILVCCFANSHSLVFVVICSRGSAIFLTGFFHYQWFSISIPCQFSHSSSRLCSWSSVGPHEHIRSPICNFIPSSVWMIQNCPTRLQANKPSQTVLNPSSIGQRSGFCHLI